MMVMSLAVIGVNRYVAWTFTESLMTAEEQVLLVVVSP